MKIADYVAAIKAKHGATSDYRVAKLLQVSPQQVSDWLAGRKLPGSLICFRIAELIGDQPAAVIADIELERSEKGEREGDASAWREMISKVGGGTLAAVLAMGLFAPPRADASTLPAVSDAASVYYVKWILQVLARAIVAPLALFPRWKLRRKPASSWLDALAPGAVVSPA